MGTPGKPPENPAYRVYRRTWFKARLTKIRQRALAKGMKVRQLDEVFANPSGRSRGEKWQRWQKGKVIPSAKRIEQLIPNAEKLDLLGTLERIQLKKGYDTFNLWQADMRAEADLEEQSLALLELEADAWTPDHAQRLEDQAQELLRRAEEIRRYNRAVKVTDNFAEEQ